MTDTMTISTLGQGVVDLTPTQRQYRDKSTDLADKLIANICDDRKFTQENLLRLIDNAVERGSAPTLIGAMLSSDTNLVNSLQTRTMRPKTIEKLVRRILRLELAGVL